MGFPHRGVVLNHPFHFPPNGAPWRLGGTGMMTLIVLSSGLLFLLCMAGWR